MNANIDEIKVLKAWKMLYSWLEMLLARQISITTSNIIIRITEWHQYILTKQPHKTSYVFYAVVAE